MGEPEAHKPAPAATQAGHSVSRDRPLRLALIADQRPCTARLETALRELPGYRLRVVDRLGDAPDSLDPPHLVMIGHATLVDLYQTDPPAHRRLSQASKLLVAVCRPDLLALRDALGIADGWVVAETDPLLIHAQIVSALEGHVVIPDDLLTPAGQDRLRLPLATRLTETELTALRLLGQGLENRQIAEEAADSESAVKSTVRTLLTKLRCRNRTEAAIFAHRQAAALESLWLAARSPDPETPR